MITISRWLKFYTGLFTLYFMLIGVIHAQTPHASNGYFRSSNSDILQPSRAVKLSGPLNVEGMSREDRRVLIQPTLPVNITKDLAHLPITELLKLRESILTNGRGTLQERLTALIIAVNFLYDISELSDDRTLRVDTTDTSAQSGLATVCQLLGQCSDGLVALTARHPSSTTILFDIPLRELREKKDTNELILTSLSPITRVLAWYGVERQWNRYETQMNAKCSVKPIRGLLEDPGRLRAHFAAVNGLIKAGIPARYAYDPALFSLSSFCIERLRGEGDAPGDTRGEALLSSLHTRCKELSKISPQLIVPYVRALSASNPENYEAAEKYADQWLTFTREVVTFGVVDAVSILDDLATQGVAPSSRLFSNVLRLRKELGISHPSSLHFNYLGQPRDVALSAPDTSQWLEGELNRRLEKALVAARKNDAAPVAVILGPRRYGGRTVKGTFYFMFH